MKISLTKIITIFSLAIMIFVSVCPPSLATLRRAEECGVESHVSKADPACGEPTYNSARSAVCGVELYKQIKSKACPGYIGPDRRETVDALCPKGYKETDVREQKETQCVYYPNPSSSYFLISYSPQALLAQAGGSRGGCSTTTTRYRTCVRPEAIQTCRLQDPGNVERYNVCRNLAHGIESYQTCERPEFGVAAYKECEIRKTKTELIAYISNLEPNIDVMGVALVQNAGNIWKLSGNEIALACYIKRWDSDPLYKDVLDDLKTVQFPALFGVAYNPNNYDCSNPPPLNVATESCSDGTPRCKFQTAYNAALKFFETNKAEVAALLDDIVARTDSTYKSQLESLNAKMDSYYKP